MKIVNVNNQVALNTNYLVSISGGSAKMTVGSSQSVDAENFANAAASASALSPDKIALFTQEVNGVAIPLGSIVKVLPNGTHSSVLTSDNVTISLQESFSTVMSAINS